MLLTLSISYLHGQQAPQTTWYDMVWDELESDGNALSSKEWLSKNRFEFTRGNQGVGMLIKYDLNLVNALQALLTNSIYPYVGFVPNLGDEIGVRFQIDALGDSIQLVRNRNIEVKIPLQLGDSVQLWLREGVVELIVGNYYETFGSFGGSYASRKNNIRVTCNAFLSPLKAYMNTEACPEIEPLINVNGQAGDNNEWNICDNEQVVISSVNIDEVYWKEDFLSCTSCTKTIVHELIDNTVEINMYGFNYGCENDTLHQKIKINHVASSIIFPKQIILCGNATETVNVSGASSVAWQNNEDLELSCTNCQSVTVGANVSSVLTGYTENENGCNQKIQIKVIHSPVPEIVYEKTEIVGEDERVSIELVTKVFRGSDISWKTRSGELLAEGNKLLIEKHIDAVNLVIQTADCGELSEEITIDYPTILPISFDVVYADSLSIGYVGKPSNCDECSVHWDFGDGQESFSVEGIHEYAEAGMYYVNLTITDRLGRSKHMSKRVHIF